MKHSVYRHPDSGRRLPGQMGKRYDEGRKKKVKDEKKSENWSALYKGGKWFDLREE